MTKEEHVKHTCELHPFLPKDNSENNPFIKEIENTGVLITPEQEFSFSQLQ